MHLPSLVARALAALLVFPLAAQQPSGGSPAPVAPTAPVTVTTAPAAPPKPAATVYDERADARQQLATALAKAKKENQRVLIQWGAEWCDWCKWLAATMKSDRELSRHLLYEYQVVHVDVGRFDKHMDVAKELGAELKSIPFLTVLDADGKPLAQQNTEPFENEVAGKKGHDAAKLSTFLRGHAAKPLVADQVLAAGLAAARQQHKRVFLHFGAPWCGWCHRLEDWMARPDVAPLLAKDFVDVKIDTDRMTGGQAIYEAQLAGAGQKASGIPWFTFLGEDGKLLAHSTGPKGNTGFPYQPDEVEHFATMLTAVKQQLTDADIAALIATLHDTRKADEAKKAKAPAAPAPPPVQPGTGGS